MYLNNLQLTVDHTSSMKKQKAKIKLETAVQNTSTHQGLSTYKDSC